MCSRTGHRERRVASSLSEVFRAGIAVASGLSGPGVQALVGGAASSMGSAAGHLHVFHKIDRFIYGRRRVHNPQS